MVQHVSQWPPDAVDRLWRFYADDPASQEEYFSRQVGAGLLSLIAESGLHPSGPIEHLDYGCGPGYLLDHSLARGNRVTGVDTSRPSLARVAGRLGQREGWRGAFPVDEVRDLTLASYELVTCVETVEHLDDAALDSVVSDLRRLASAQGVVVVTTPNDEDLSRNRAYCPFCDRTFHKVQHVRSFSAASLTGVLEARGLRVVFVGATSLWDWQPRRHDWKDVSPRLALAGARRTKARLADRIHGRRGCDTEEFQRRFGDAPHLVALARPAS